MHDRRFVEAWKTAGFEVSTVATEACRDGGPATKALLDQQIQAFRPEIVQVGPVARPAWDLIQVWDGPLIVTSWGFDLLEEIDQELGLAENVCAVLKRANLLFVDNRAARKRATVLGMDESRIVEFPWGLDDHWFSPASRAPIADLSRVTILCTRRHEDIYRVDDVLQSFLSAAADCGNIRLQLVGSGSLTPKLQARANASGLAHRIEFLGEIDHDLLPELYRQADIYVTASQVDGTSVSMLEAMASGAVVVGSLNEGNKQWLSGETGYSFDVGDTTTLTSILVALAKSSPEDVAEARRRAANATSLVAQHANWTKSARRFPDFAQAAVKHWGDV